MPLFLTRSAGSMPSAWRVAQLRALGCALLLLPAPALLAAANTVTFSAEARAEHDSNVRLSPGDNKTSILGGSSTATVNWDHRRGHSEGNLNLVLRSSWYNRDEYNSDDQFLRGRWSFLGERHQISLTGGFDRDSTRTSEIEDTGRVSDAAVRRERGNVGASWGWSWTERQQLSASINATDVSYGSDRRQFVDYRFYSGSLGWTLRLSERTDLTVQGFGNLYRPEFRDASFNFFGVPVPLSYKTESEALGADVGLSHRYTEHLELSASLGNSRVETEYSIRDPLEFCPSEFSEGFGICELRDRSANSRVARLEATYNRERHRASLRLNQETTPSSDGRLLEARRARAAWRWQLSERGTVRSALTWGRNEDVDGGSGLPTAQRSERDYYIGVLGYDHRLGSNWVLGAEYRYRYQKREILDRSANSHIGELYIRYEPEKPLFGP